MNVYGPFYVGQRVKIRGDFAVSGTATDPTTKTIKVRTPSGVEATYTDLTDEAGTGGWSRQVTLDESGVWTGYIVGTGTAAAATEFLIRVESHSFTP